MPVRPVPVVVYSICPSPIPPVPPAPQDGIFDFLSLILVFCLSALARPSFVRGSMKLARG